MSTEGVFSWKFELTKIDPSSLEEIAKRFNVDLQKLSKKRYLATFESYEDFSKFHHEVMEKDLVK